MGDELSFGRIRSRGDQALFGGRTTQDTKDRLGVPKSRALADFLPTITIKAKDFANEITNFNIQRDDLQTETAISHEHVKNNRDVRNLLTQRNIVPENLPAAEDVKKVERRLCVARKKRDAQYGTVLTPLSRYSQWKTVFPLSKFDLARQLGRDAPGRAVGRNAEQGERDRLAPQLCGLRPREPHD